MIDYHSELVSALETVLPTHYELALTSGTQTPCISYQERNNYDTDTGDTLGYSRITYTVKVWGNQIAIIQNYAKEIDKVLRPLGFKRTSAQELHDNQSTMIQKILTYEALASENY
jgi:hypothetical protein